jgi:hypothetical protein
MQEEGGCKQEEGSCMQGEDGCVQEDGVGACREKAGACRKRAAACRERTGACRKTGWCMQRVYKAAVISTAPYISTHTFVLYFFFKNLSPLSLYTHKHLDDIISQACYDSNK